ncbi:MAG: hypothetical protein ABIN35_07705 [candidate division WOR-3 bacterium]
MWLLLITLFSVVIFVGGIKIIFSKNIFLDKFFDSFILIILGTFLLFYNYTKNSENFFSFREDEITLKKENKNYIVIFSKPDLDLSLLESLKDSQEYEIKIFFSNVRIKQNSISPFDFDIKGFLYSSKLHTGKGFLTGQIDENFVEDSLNLPIKVKFKLYFSSLEFSRE